MALTVADSLWRNQTAANLLGQILGKTSSDIVNELFRTEVRGWLYFNARALVYIGDVPMRGASLATNNDRVACYSYQDLGNATKLTAPMVAFDGVVEFRNGLKLKGRKNTMKLLYRLASG